MPVYDYHCNDCHKSFEQTLTLHQHDGSEVRCPHCGSKKIEERVAKRALGFRLWASGSRRLASSGVSAFWLLRFHLNALPASSVARSG